MSEDHEPPSLPAAGEPPVPETFAEPILRGGRFADHTIPVDALDELKAYQSLLLKLAKVLYRSRQDVTRVRPGFDDEFKLKLKGVEKDCAIPVLGRSTLGQPESPQGDAVDWFVEARELLEQTVLALSEGRDLPAEFPQDMLSDLQDFGAGLLPDESIELRSPGRATGAVYDDRVRLALRQRQNPPTYKELAAFSGTVIGFDLDSSTFKLRTREFRILPGKLTAALEPRVLTALKGRKYLRVDVRGHTTFLGTGVPKSLDEILGFRVWSRSSEAAVTDIEDQIAQLNLLKPGWLDGGGDAVRPSDSGWARDFVLRLMAEQGLPKPYLYPTPNGGVQAEWSHDPWEVTLTFDFEGKSVSSCATDVTTGSFKHFESRLGEKEKEGELLQLLLSVLPQSPEVER